MGMWQLAVCICILAVFAEKGHSQIPTICANEDDFTGSICCPNDCGEHGECVDVQLPTHFDPNSTDVRSNWPHYFNRTCKCDENYFGVNCSRCKYGHFGENCMEKEVIARKSVQDLTPAEWRDYINIIKMTRNYDSGYVVITGETTKPTCSPPSDSIKYDVKLYNFFAWLHHYAAKDNGKSMSCNCMILYRGEMKRIELQSTWGCCFFVFVLDRLMAKYFKLGRPWVQQV